MTSTFLQKPAEANDKDYQIAKLKAAVFDCRQKERNYQQLHTVMTELHQKRSDINVEEQGI